MADHHEKVFKEYDPVIMRRLLGFMKPYSLPATLAVIALLIATAAELATPVIMQRAIDEHIMSRFRRFAVAERTEQVLSRNGLLEEALRVGDAYYLPEIEGEKLPADTKEELIGSELYSRRNWYLTPMRDDGELRQLLQEYPGLFDRQDGYVIADRDEIEELSQEEKLILRGGDIQGIARKAGLYLVLLTGTLVFMFLQVYLMAYTGQGVMRDIRTRLFGHTIRQSLGFLGGKPVGTLVTRITNDVETINEFFTSVATSILRDFALMIGVVITLFLLDVRLAAFTVASLPPVILLTLFFRVKARDAYRRVRRGVARVNAFLSEHISGMEVVQMFGREKISGRMFRDRNGDLLNANLAEMMVFAVFRPLINLLTSVSIGTVLYFGGQMVLGTTVSLGIMIAFVNLIQKFYQPVMDFAEKFTILQSAMAGSERVFNLLDTDESIPPGGSAQLPETLRGHIEFRNVSFAYKEDEPVLRDLSFSIEPGETVAIVGYTGAGKTTIANLLARLWDIQEGEILIDGIDIRSLPLERLRSLVQPVQQEVFLFADTVQENIRLGMDISPEEVRRSARTVRADRFIEQLSDSYDTVLREGGANLSTGQRQLLSFSRVIAQDPQILILDEATGSIDTETEVLIQEAINTIMSGRTSIVIAHRLSTIRHADRILVLNEGQLVESGSHEELLREDGLYATLYRLQYAGQR
jgi:ATP-binding cassette subfamily B protein